MKSKVQREDQAWDAFGHPDGIAPGTYEGLWLATYAIPQNNRGVFLVLFVSPEKQIPKFLGTILERFLFGKATCRLCSSAMTSLSMQILPGFKFSGDRTNAFVCCACGHSMWQVGAEVLARTESAMKEAIRSHRRKELLNNANGRNTSDEVSAILLAQKGRCIYCNIKFSKIIPPEKDHLLAIRRGGTKWALNLVMACKSCNSRRCDIPFRTYCKLLSPAQNNRILMHFRRRFFALDFDQLSTEEFASFEEALALHDAKHPRYIDIMRICPAKRRYAHANKLLPRTVGALLRKSSLLQTR